MNLQHNQSNEIEPFLKMIAANPTDMTARLVFADWLEERAEPWGAFIRAQIALATGNLKTAERTELTTLAAQLYWKHHRYWNGQVYRQWIGTPLTGKHAHGDGLRGWQYRLGMPEILDVNANCFVKHAELLLAAAPFRIVLLRQAPQPWIPFVMAHAPILYRLEKVVLPIVVGVNANELSSLPYELAQRIHLGLREQKLLGWVKNP